MKHLAEHLWFETPQRAEFSQRESFYLFAR